MSAAIAVFGAGSWGTALADLLARRGHRVRLWAFEAEVAAAIAERHENPSYLLGHQLSLQLEATTSMGAAAAGAEAFLIATPSHVTRDVLGQLGGHLPANPLIIGATKGIETESLALMSTVAAETLPPHRYVALSGPSFAVEVAGQQPTAVVAASVDQTAAERAQELLATGYFRVYTNGDVVGTELAGSLKNVIAIAAGILEGLGLGNNPRAALVTRGLAEMTRLGLAMGADARTFSGLAGMGDLILTTCGSLSRNRALGVALAQGVPLAQYRREHRSVAEGANTSLAAVRLGVTHHVDLPIASQVADILFAEKPAREAIGELMDRTPKPEH